VDAELLKEMRDAGCTYVFYGVEAGDDHQLETMHKDADSARSWKTIAQTCATGIRTGVSIIVGYPGETDGQLADTFRRISAFDPGMVSVSLSMFSLYPGTEEWARAKQGNLVRDDAYEHPLSTEEVWKNFDEGVGAVHLIDSARASRLLDIAVDILGPRIELNLTPSAMTVSDLTQALMS
jgi:radical SAM superfamily enzyme YgiQ (UPF0313 family)